MNYYKFNIGDYAAATRHLSMLEHGAYRLLLDLYYTTEQPIPSDIKAAARKAGARGKDDAKAVETVLTEFFTLTEAGWVHGRCDAEIATYKQGEQEQEQRANHERERMARHRERRAQMFDALRERGIIPAWDIPMKELQQLFNVTCNAPETHLQREQVVYEAPPATAITINQEPRTNNQTSPPTPTAVVAGGDGEGKAAAPPKNGQHPPDGEDAPVHVLAAKAMRKAGVSDANPGHAELQALARSGVPIDVFSAAATDAVGRGKGFAYALKIVRSQLSAAAEVASLGRFSQAAASPLLPGAI